MTQSTTLKEFVVSLGFEIDRGQEKRFNDFIQNATRAVQAFGAAFASYKVAQELDKVSAGFERLHYMAKRLNTTVGSIKSISYAVEQLGGSSESAQSSIEKLGKQLRENPTGIANFLQHIGVGTKDANGKMREGRDLIIDIGKRLGELYKTNPRVALGQAEILGIDEQTFQAIINPDFGTKLREQESIFKRMGIDPEKMGEQSAKIEQAFRRIGLQFEAIGIKVAQIFGPIVEDALNKFSAWFDNNSESVAASLQKLGDLFLMIAKSAWKFIEPWATDDEAFKKLERWISNLSGGLRDILDKMLKIINAGSSLAEFFGITGAHAATFDGTEVKSSMDEQGRTLSPGAGIDLRSESGGRNNTPVGRGKALSANQREAYWAARDEGLSDTAARALVANMTGEALHKPGDHHWDVKHMSQGIVQWDPQRSAAIAKQFGAEPRFLSVKDQTRAAIWEINNNSRFSRTKQALEGNDPNVMLDALVRNYESPANAGAQVALRSQHYRRLPRSFDQSPNTAAAASNAPSRKGSVLNLINPRDPSGPLMPMPMGVSPSQISNASNFQKTTNVNAPQHITINGVSDPHEAVKLLRTTSDIARKRIIRDMQGDAQ